ncbi:MAG: hypothetical protein WD600_07945, partial [Pseudohongiella sp.]
MGEMEENHETRTNDPFNCYTTVSEKISMAIDCGEALDGVKPGPFGRYVLRMVYVKDHMELLATKAGCSDFSRVSAAGLAQWLVRDLLGELSQFERSEKQAA